MIHEKIKSLRLRAAPVNYSSLSVDAKGEIGDDRILKGYLCVWGVRDTYGTIFLRGCFAKSIQERGPDSQSKQKIIMLWQHETRNPIGQFRVLKEDDYGLYFEAAIDEIPEGERALRQVRSGTINQFSIGFDYIWDMMEYQEATDSILLKEVILFEGSPVSRGSNSETYALRTADQLLQDKIDLDEETEDFIKTLPRAKQLEVRNILTRQISLAKVEPTELRQTSLDTTKPDDAGGINYCSLVKLF